MGRAHHTPWYVIFLLLSMPAETLSAECVRAQPLRRPLCRFQWGGTLQAERLQPRRPNVRPGPRRLSLSLSRLQLTVFLRSTALLWSLPGTPARPLLACLSHICADPCTPTLFDQPHRPPLYVARWRCTASCSVWCEHVWFGMQGRLPLPFSHHIRPAGKNQPAGGCGPGKLLMRRVIGWESVRVVRDVRLLHSMTAMTTKSSC